MRRGFTLIETLVAISIFLIISMTVYRIYVNLFAVINLNQYRILAFNVANEQLEIARNMPYSKIGIVGGIPNGYIPAVQTLVRGGITFTATTTVRNIDLPFDGTLGGSPNDLSPADNKLVEVEVSCISCKNLTPVTVTANIAPKSLETASVNGALFIKVFDANGTPVEGASVHIEYPTTTPIVIDDVTDVKGMLQIIDAPPGVGAYRITVSKSGYSTSRTYATGGAGNPLPTIPHATVVVQQVTQVSFSIDKLSTLSFASVTPTCTSVSNIDFSLVGAKLIGQNVYKYSSNLITNSSGTYSNNAMEWDAYTVTGIDTTHDIIGLNPLNPITLNPDTTQSTLLIVAPKNPRSLLVTVKDSSTLLPVADATVTLTNTGTYNQTQTTGRGFINQTDWSVGAGQDQYVNTSQYLSDDGRVSVTAAPGEVRLLQSGGTYQSSGTLTSSTIDTGSASNFYSLVWLPASQPLVTGTNSARFQLATNASSTASTWTFKGPDGTASTYYTTSNAVIHSSHNGDRYVRYKMFLSTAVATATPNISDVATDVRISIIIFQISQHHM